MNAFLVGSRVYGTPREDSDIDLVVRIDHEQAQMIRALADPPKGNDPVGVVRFGKLNLIICETDGGYEAWREGMDEVMDEFRSGPVTRDRAMEIFHQYRANYAAVG